jgi:hypothetical protein
MRLPAIYQEPVSGSELADLPKNQFYSQRTATIGSTRVARRAGT